MHISCLPDVVITSRTFLPTLDERKCQDVTIGKRDIVLYLHFLTIIRLSDKSVRKRATRVLSAEKVRRVHLSSSDYTTAMNHQRL